MGMGVNQEQEVTLAVDHALVQKQRHKHVMVRNLDIKADKVSEANRPNAGKFFW